MFLFEKALNTSPNNGEMQDLQAHPCSLFVRLMQAHLWRDFGSCSTDGRKASPLSPPLCVLVFFDRVTKVLETRNISHNSPSESFLIETFFFSPLSSRHTKDCGLNGPPLFWANPPTFALFSVNTVLLIRSSQVLPKRASLEYRGFMFFPFSVFDFSLSLLLITYVIHEPDGLWFTIFLPAKQLLGLFFSCRPQPLPTKPLGVQMNFVSFLFCKSVFLVSCPFLPSDVLPFSFDLWRISFFPLTVATDETFFRLPLLLLPCFWSILFEETGFASFPKLPPPPISLLSS